MSPEEEHSLEIAERNVERLSALVEDMLHVSRYQVGRMPVVPAPSDLHTVVREAVESFSAAAAAKGIRLDVDSAGDGACWIDGRRFSQVLYNLLGNALKFTGPGGHVQVRSRAAADGLRVEVQDDGMGIRAEDLPKLFQPFSQVHALQTGQSGSGLGLYICRAIVELHGGTITAESPGLGRGTTVRIWMPTRAAVAPTNEDAAAGPT